MNLSIVRTTGDQKETLSIKDASEGIAYAVLRRFLPEEKDLLTKDPAIKAADTPKAATPAPETAPPTPKPKATPSKLNDREFARAVIESAKKEVRLVEFTNVAEALAKPAETKLTKYHKPKIIEKNGMDLYEVETICGACGHEGFRLATSDNIFVKCRECDQKLKIEPMYPEEPFAANKAGVAFKANEPFISYREQNALRKELAAHESSS